MYTLAGSFWPPKPGYQKTAVHNERKDYSKFRGKEGAKKRFAVAYRHQRKEGFLKIDRPGVGVKPEILVPFRTQVKSALTDLL